MSSDEYDEAVNSPPIRRQNPGQLGGVSAAIEGQMTEEQIQSEASAIQQRAGRPYGNIDNDPYSGEQAAMPRPIEQDMQEEMQGSPQSTPNVWYAQAQQPSAPAQTQIARELSRADLLPEVPAGSPEHPGEAPVYSGPKTPGNGWEMGTQKNNNVLVHRGVEKAAAELKLLEDKRPELPDKISTKTGDLNFEIRVTGGGFYDNPEGDKQIYSPELEQAESNLQAKLAEKLDNAGNLILPDRVSIREIKGEQSLVVNDPEQEQLGQKYQSALQDLEMQKIAIESLVSDLEKIDSGFAKRGPLENVAPEEIDARNVMAAKINQDAIAYNNILKNPNSKVNQTWMAFDERQQDNIGIMDDFQTELTKWRSELNPIEENFLTKKDTFKDNVDKYITSTADWGKKYKLAANRFNTRNINANTSLNRWQKNVDTFNVKTEFWNDKANAWNTWVDSKPLEEVTDVVAGIKTDVVAGIKQKGGDFYNELRLQNIQQKMITITEKTAERFGGLDALKKQGFNLGDQVFEVPPQKTTTEPEKIWTDTKTGLRIDPVKSGIKVDDKTGDISVDKLILSEHQEPEAVAAYKKLRDTARDSVPFILFKGTQPQSLELPGEETIQGIPAKDGKVSEKYKGILGEDAKIRGVSIDAFLGTWSGSGIIATEEWKKRHPELAAGIPARLGLGIIDIATHFGTGLETVVTWDPSKRGKGIFTGGEGFLGTGWIAGKEDLPDVMTAGIAVVGGTLTQKGQSIAGPIRAKDVIFPENKAKMDYKYRVPGWAFMKTMFGGMQIGRAEEAQYYRDSGWGALIGATAGEIVIGKGISVVGKVLPLGTLIGKVGRKTKVFPAIGFAGRLAMDIPRFAVGKSAVHAGRTVQKQGLIKTGVGMVSQLGVPEDIVLKTVRKKTATTAGTLPIHEKAVLSTTLPEPVTIATKVGGSLIKFGEAIMPDVRYTRRSLFSKPAQKIGKEWRKGKDLPVGKIEGEEILQEIPKGQRYPAGPGELTAGGRDLGPALKEFGQTTKSDAGHLLLTRKSEVHFMGGIGRRIIPVRIKSEIVEFVGGPSGGINIKEIVPGHAPSAFYDRTKPRGNIFDYTAFELEKGTTKMEGIKTLPGIARSLITGSKLPKGAMQFSRRQEHAWGTYYVKKKLGRIPELEAYIDPTGFAHLQGKEYRGASGILAREQGLIVKERSSLKRTAAKKIQIDDEISQIYNVVERNPEVFKNVMPFLKEGVGSNPIVDINTHNSIQKWAVNYNYRRTKGVGTYKEKFADEVAEGGDILQRGFQSTTKDLVEYNIPRPIEGVRIGSKRLKPTVYKRTWEWTPKTKKGTVSQFTVIDTPIGPEIQDKIITSLAKMETLSKKDIQRIADLENFKKLADNARSKSKRTVTELKEKRIHEWDTNPKLKQELDDLLKKREDILKENKSTHDMFMDVPYNRILPSERRMLILGIIDDTKAIAKTERVNITTDNLMDSLRPSISDELIGPKVPSLVVDRKKVKAIVSKALGKGHDIKRTGAETGHNISGDPHSWEWTWNSKRLSKKELKYLSDVSDGEINLVRKESLPGFGSDPGKSITFLDNLGVSIHEIVRPETVGKITQTPSDDFITFKTRTKPFIEKELLLQEKVIVEKQRRVTALNDIIEKSTTWDPKVQKLITERDSIKRSIRTQKNEINSILNDTSKYHEKTYIKGYIHKDGKGLLSGVQYIEVTPTQIDNLKAAIASGERRTPKQIVALNEDVASKKAKIIKLREKIDLTNVPDSPKIAREKAIKKKQGYRDKINDVDAEIKIKENEIRLGQVDLWDTFYSKDIPDIMTVRFKDTKALKSDNARLLELNKAVSPGIEGFGDLARQPDETLAQYWWRSGEMKRMQEIDSILKTKFSNEMAKTGDAKFLPEDNALRRLEVDKGKKAGPGQVPAGTADAHWLERQKPEFKLLYKEWRNLSRKKQLSSKQLDDIKIKKYNAVKEKDSAAVIAQDIIDTKKKANKAKKDLRDFNVQHDDNAVSSFASGSYDSYTRGRTKDETFLSRDQWNTAHAQHAELKKNQAKMGGDDFHSVDLGGKGAALVDNNTQVHMRLDKGDLITDLTPDAQGALRRDDFRLGNLLDDKLDVKLKHMETTIKPFERPAFTRTGQLGFLTKQKQKTAQRSVERTALGNLQDMEQLTGMKPLSRIQQTMEEQRLELATALRIDTPFKFDTEPIKTIPDIKLDLLTPKLKPPSLKTVTKPALKVDLASRQDTSFKLDLMQKQRLDTVQKQKFKTDLGKLTDYKITPKGPFDLGLHTDIGLKLTDYDTPKPLKPVTSKVDPTIPRGIPPVPWLPKLSGRRRPFYDKKTKTGIFAREIKRDIGDLSIMGKKGIFSDMIGRRSKKK